MNESKGLKDNEVNSHPFPSRPLHKNEKVPHVHIWAPKLDNSLKNHVKRHEKGLKSETLPSKGATFSLEAPTASSIGGTTFIKQKIDLNVLQRYIFQRKA